jgi:hypothetical protein
MIPVLIGSEALRNYGYECKPTDWDIVVTPEQKAAFCKKYHNGFDDNPNYIFVDDGKGDYTKVDLIEYPFILTVCTTFAEDLSVKYIEHPTLGKLIIPPLEILYAIKKGHIHRILNSHGSNFNNVIEWRKHMHMYLWMRDKLGYERMDKVTHGSYRTSMKSKNETLTEYYCRMIYVDSFNKTNNRIGDTMNSLDKSEDTFFTDSTIRYIDHDKLHEKVALMCRDSKELLFRKFQKYDFTVEMDEDMFLAAPFNEQVQTIREEIIVLMLERKIIPELVKSYKENGAKYIGFDRKYREDQMLELSAHFICNLCGQGDHWLRRWCLDHYRFFEKTDAYDYAGMESIAKSIIGLDIVDSTPEDGKTKALTLIEFITLGPVIGKIESRYDGLHDVLVENYISCPDEIWSKPMYDNKWGLSIGLSLLNIIYTPDKSVSLKCFSKNNLTGTVTVNYNNNDIIDYLLNIFSSTTKLCYTSDILFDVEHNIGIYNGTNGPNLFRFSHIDKVGTEIKYSIDYMDLNGTEKSCEKRFSRRCYAYYFYSHDDTCEWEQKVNIINRYLSSYGWVPHEITPFLEYFARYTLDVSKDEGKLNTKYIGGNYVYAYNDEESFSDESIISND